MKGKPEEVMIENAASYSNTLIAMATHGRSGVDRWLLGSVAEKVLRVTTNPLLPGTGDKRWKKRRGEDYQESHRTFRRITLWRKRCCRM